MAKDAGSPQLASDPSDVNIEVIRNDHAPTFERERYTVAISQAREERSTITQVRASDDDPRVSVWRCVRGLHVPCSAALFAHPASARELLFCVE